jgi:hypothetical protein
MSYVCNRPLKFLVTRMYKRRGKLLRVLDEDTLELYVEMGLPLGVIQRVKISHLEPSQIGEKKTTQVLKDWFTQNTEDGMVYLHKITMDPKRPGNLEITSHGNDRSFNQFLADVD